MQISSSSDEDYYSSLYSSWYDTTSTTSTSSASSDFVSSFTSTSSTDSEDLFSLDYSDTTSEKTTEELLEEAEAKSQSTYLQMLMSGTDSSGIQESYAASFSSETTYTDEILDEMLESMQTEGTEASEGVQGQGRPPQGYGQMGMDSMQSSMSMQGGMGGGMGQGGMGGGMGGGADMSNYKPINSYA